MSDGFVVLGLWLLFGASHVCLSGVSMRPRLVGRIGSGGYLLLFSAVALACFVPLVWFYFAHKHTGPWLYTIALTPVLRWSLYVLMGVAFVLVTASFLQPSPAATGSSSAGARGVLRLTRHPLFMGVGLFGLLHLIPNASFTDVMFFGGFPLFAAVGCWHQDQRKLVTEGAAYAQRIEGTPFFPFTGSDTWRGIRELPPSAVAIGIALTVLLRWFHAPLFGG